MQKNNDISNTNNKNSKTLSLKEEEQCGESCEEESEEEIIPRFIPKNERQTLTNNNNKQESTENNTNNQKTKNINEVHQQNINYLIQQENNKKESEKEVVADNADDLNLNLPDDTDNPNDISEYTNWKLRELNRIKRDIEKYEQYRKEQDELQKRRKMTEKEIKEDNIKLGSDSTKNHFKSKINFLQKYYHKGVFFQDEAENNENHIYNRDFNLPTWEDKVDRTNLPSILAKRRGNLFKKSQSKYTHLNAEDTTNFDKNYIIPNQILSNINKYRKK